MKPPVRTLVVDDERLARLNLLALLAEHDDVRVVASCAASGEAADALRREEVDLLLLDVRMPGANGLELARALRPDEPPLVVFVTAYERHALEAFDLAALDYLLKPVDRRRLAETLRRVRAAISRPATGPFRRGARASQRDMAAEPDDTLSPADDRIVVRAGRRRQVVPISAVRWVEAWGNYVRLHTVHGPYLHRATLTAVERRLPRDAFVRVHRSRVVCLAAIRSLDERPDGRQVARLTDGSEVEVARRRLGAVRRRLKG